MRSPASGCGLAAVFVAMVLSLGAAPAPAHPAAEPAATAKASKAQERKARHRHRKQVGKASIYGRRFHGRRMADGNRMSPTDDNAASKTLPLGSKARVRNLETGKSAVVTIQDRGPYVPGRIIDLSPQTARDIGLTRKDGVAPVEVVPLAAADEPAE